MPIKMTAAEMLHQSALCLITLIFIEVQKRLSAACMRHGVMLKKSNARIKTSKLLSSRRRAFRHTFYAWTEEVWLTKLWEPDGKEQQRAGTADCGKHTDKDADSQR